MSETCQNLTSDLIIRDCHQPSPPSMKPNLQGLNPHYFHIKGGGHQPNSRDLYTHYKDSLLKVWQSHPFPVWPTLSFLSKIPQDEGHRGRKYGDSSGAFSVRRDGINGGIVGWTNLFSLYETVWSAAGSPKNTGWCIMYLISIMENDGWLEESF